MTNSKKCYLCNNSDFQNIDGIVRDNPNLKILKCKNCSLVCLSSNEHIDNNFYQTGQMHGGVFNASAWEKACYIDDKRRFDFLKKELKNKTLIDFGCGAGGFLKMASTITENIFGVELDEKQRKYLNENNFKIFSSIDDINQNVDIITMFHVLEHIKEPIELLKKLKSKLKDKNSQIIIEVPNSLDALIGLYKSKAFSRFTWWSCHVFTFNKKNLISMANKAGYKVNYVKNIQRYGILNHLYWLIKGKPGGHEKFKRFSIPFFEWLYWKFLSSINATDTILISLSLED